MAGTYPHDNVAHPLFPSTSLIDGTSCLWAEKDGSCTCFILRLCHDYVHRDHAFNARTRHRRKKETIMKPQKVAASRAPLKPASMICRTHCDYLSCRHSRPSLDVVNFLASFAPCLVAALRPLSPSIIGGCECDALTPEIKCPFFFALRTTTAPLRPPTIFKIFLPMGPTSTTEYCHALFTTSEALRDSWNRPMAENDRLLGLLQRGLPTCVLAGRSVGALSKKRGCTIAK